MAQTVAVFPGTFDPLTNGHTDIVLRSASIFDKIVIAVLNNANKSTMFTVEERVAVIREEFSGWENRIEVESFSGLLVDFVRQKNTKVIVRGLRATTDYEYEAQMALMNRHLSTNHIETFFLMTREENSYISSSIVRQVLVLGGDVEKLVPRAVNKFLLSRFCPSGQKPMNKDKS
jgi:pantetheine-phosphate adenylyltransferase